MALVSVSYIFRAFIKRAIIFIEGAVTFIKEAVIFIGKESLVIEGGLFKIAKAGVADNIKEVNRCNLRRQLIIYKLKGLLLLINSLISIFNYFIGLSS